MIDEVSINLTNFPTVTRFSSHMKKISESEVSILKKRKKSGKSFSEVSNSDHEHPGSRQHHRADNSSESLKFRSKTMLSASAAADEDDDADDFVDASQPPPKKKKASVWTERRMTTRHANENKVEDFIFESSFFVSSASDFRELFRQLLKTFFGKIRNPATLKQVELSSGCCCR